MYSHRRRLTDEDRKDSAAVKMASSSKAENETGRGSTGLSRATATLTAVTDDSRKKAAAVEEQGSQRKSPRGASTADTARPGTHHDHNPQQQQQQHLIKATELLKRAAEKQLTLSSLTLTERLLVAQLSTLPSVNSPSSSEQSATRDTARKSSGSRTSKDLPSVNDISASVPKDDIRTAMKPDNVAADDNEVIYDADSARQESLILRENVTGRYVEPTVNNISERRGNLSSDVDNDERTERHSNAAESKDTKVQFQQDDSDLRIVS